MPAFMVICTFKEDTVMNEVFAVVAEEQAQVAALVAAGRVGQVRLSLGRGTVFIEVYADDVDAAATTVRTLPMARWWDLDLYPLGEAPVTGSSS